MYTKTIKINDKEYTVNCFEENGKTVVELPEELKKLDGYGTALKPAFEPIVLCRKPRGKETFVDCALNYGTGSLNVDGSRIQTSGRPLLTLDAKQTNNSTYQGRMDNSLQGGSKYIGETTLGRFPANLGLICDCEKEPCECDHQTIGDSSRFFYTAKSSRKERNLGLDTRNNHPTVKPIKLIEYLATMLKSPINNSSILIPFSGSGSEIIGAMFSGWNNITGIEIDSDYVGIADERIKYWSKFDSYERAMRNEN